MRPAKLLGLLFLALSPPAALAEGAGNPGDPGQALERPSGASAAPPARGPLIRGRDIFERTCVKCHGDPSSRAPRIGHPVQWEPRIEQGLQILVRHALEGHGGPDGMPAKGGFSELGNDDVAAAVAYIVSESRALAPEAGNILSACEEDQPGSACTPEMSRKYLLLYLFQGLSEGYR